MAGNSNVDLILDLVGNDPSPRMIIAGPCGSGKTYLSALIIQRLPSVQHIERDVIDRPIGVRQDPCSIGFLNLNDCFRDSISSAIGGYIIDMGGASIFRRSADNEERLSQLSKFKRDNEISVILLTPTKAVLKSRFVGSKNREAEEFEDIWASWKSVEEPYWAKCADLIIPISENS
jgi:hypothetical protein